MDNLSELNKRLFETLDRVTEDNLTNEELELELKRADAVTKIASQIIQNGELAFRVVQHRDAYGYGSSERVLPALLKYDD